jgi:hypothetical protein
MVGLAPTNTQLYLNQQGLKPLSVAKNKTKTKTKNKEDDYRDD